MFDKMGSHVSLKEKGGIPAPPKLPLLKFQKLKKKVLTAVQHLSTNF